MKIDLTEDELRILQELLLSDYSLMNLNETIREPLLNKLKLEPRLQTNEDPVVLRHNEIYELTSEHLDFETFELYDFFMIRDSILKLQNQLIKYNEILDFAQLQIYPNYDLNCNLIWEQRNKTIH